jgi:hypothetical protein
VEDGGIKIIDISISGSEDDVIEEVQRWRYDFINVWINIVNECIGVKDTHIGDKCNDSILVNVSIVANIEQPVCKVLLIYS